MNNEHQQLKEICDTIGYESNTFGYGVTGFWEKKIITNSGFEMIICDVREIIFTPEFKDMYNNFFWENKKQIRVFDDVIEHLNNPVEYLYNLIQGK